MTPESGKRRDKGTGTVHFDPVGATWRAEIGLGSRPKVYRNFKTREEAEAFLEGMVAQYGNMLDFDRRCEYCGKPLPLLRQKRNQKYCASGGKVPSSCAAGAAMRKLRERRSQLQQEGR